MVRLQRATYHVRSNNKHSFEKHTSNAGRHNLRTYVSLGSLDLRNKEVSVHIILC